MISSSFDRERSDSTEDIVINEPNDKVPIFSEVVHSSAVSKKT